MLYKPDFDEAFKRIQAFWAHDCLDRCALQVIARKEGCQPPPGPEVDLLTRKTNVEYVLGQVERNMQSLHYLAEALPVYIPGLVCTDTAAYLMDEIDIREDTVWYPPIIDNWETFPLKFDRNNRWWQLTRQMTEAAVERGRERYRVSLPDFQVAMDIISLLRSPQRLCLDLVDNGMAVKRAAGFIFDEVYVPCYREIRSIITRYSELVADEMSLVSTGDHDVIQCDFIALISPKHFEEFCLPDIQKQCRMLDTSIFHLDGPDATRHLDMLLEIKELDAIQWVPGAGRSAAVAWLPMLKKVQRAGKSLLIYSPAQDVEAVLQQLSPKGLMISVEGIFESLDEANLFIESTMKK